jgi:hypothetical protein
MGTVPTGQECHILNPPSDVFGVNECKRQEFDAGTKPNAVLEDIYFLDTQIA